MRYWVWVAVLLATGCASDHTPHPRALTADGYPADFSFTLLVDDAAGRRLFLVEPDRTLRAATGDGVHAGLYPPRTAVLTRGQMHELYALLGEPGGGHHERASGDAPRAVVEALDGWAGLE